MYEQKAVAMCQVMQKGMSQEFAKGGDAVSRQCRNMTGKPVYALGTLQL
jgi:hypothetical protein